MRRTHIENRRRRRVRDLESRLEGVELLLADRRPLAVVESAAPSPAEHLARAVEAEQHRPSPRPLNQPERNTQ